MIVNLVKPDIFKLGSIFITFHMNEGNPHIVESIKILSFRLHCFFRYYINFDPEH